MKWKEALHLEPKRFRPGAALPAPSMEKLSLLAEKWEQQW